jgi:ADP-ribosylglycohydrolase
MILPGRRNSKKTETNNMAENKIVYSEPEDYFPKEIREKYKLGEFTESNELRQIKAVMLGHAVGDALGVPVEFCSREELEEAPVTDMMGWGTYPVPEGCWSDDTSMALATLDSLKKGTIDYKEIMDNFFLWASEDKYTPTGEMFDIGRTTLTAIRRYCEKGGKPPLECGLSDELSNGNGALMRIHPFVLYLFFNGYSQEDALPVIHEASAITHAHEISKVSCGIYTFVLWELIKSADKTSILVGLEKARKHYEHSEVIHHFSRVFNMPKSIESRKEIKSTGYVVDTLEAAIWCILTTNHYKSCVLSAVNLGDDTDTVASIAGGLAGALYGFQGIPKDWINKLKKKDYIETMCEEACAGWKR